MYQTLIWSLHLRDHARRLGPSLDAKDLQGAADPLVDRMGRYAQFYGNLFRRQMLVDEQQSVQLALAEPADALGNLKIARLDRRSVRPAVIVAVHQFI